MDTALPLAFSKKYGQTILEDVMPRHTVTLAAWSGRWWNYFEIFRSPEFGILFINIATELEMGFISHE